MSLVVPIIQIAGIRDLREAEMLVSLGVTALGFPLGPGIRNPDLSIPEAGRIVTCIGTQVTVTLITYLNSAREILSLCDDLSLNHVQLHGDVPFSEVEQLKKQRSTLFVIQSLVIGMTDLSQLENRMKKLDPFVDAFLTDTFDPITGARGATGKTHDWQHSRRVIEWTKKPVIVAGGLSPSNVAKAIEVTRPSGVDVHTGVEDSMGNKDRSLVRQFVEQARRAFKLQLR